MSMKRSRRVEKHGEGGDFELEIQQQPKTFAFLRKGGHLLCFKITCSLPLTNVRCHVQRQR
jgi:hypothetical protein